MDVYFYESCIIYLCEPAGQAHIHKYIQPYYTLKCLISYLLLCNCFNSEFRKHLNKKKARKTRGVHPAYNTRLFQRCYALFGR